MLKILFALVYVQLKFKNFNIDGVSCDTCRNQQIISMIYSNSNKPWKSFKKETNDDFEQKLNLYV